jgi:hypothetical protein
MEEILEKVEEICKVRFLSDVGLVLKYLLRKPAVDASEAEEIGMMIIRKIQESQESQKTFETTMVKLDDDSLIEVDDDSESKCSTFEQERIYRAEAHAEARAKAEEINKKIRELVEEKEKILDADIDWESVCDDIEGESTITVDDTVPLLPEDSTPPLVTSEKIENSKPVGTYSIESKYIIPITKENTKFMEHESKKNYKKSRRSSKIPKEVYGTVRRVMMAQELEEKAKAGEPREEISDELIIKLSNIRGILKKKDDKSEQSDYIG